jgi:hypothetical protein
VFLKAMTGARKWSGGELPIGSGSVHGWWRSLLRRTVGAVYERQRRRRLQSEAPPRSWGGAQLGDEARQQHALLGGCKMAMDLTFARPSSRWRFPAAAVAARRKGIVGGSVGR